jgi:hypothetical protein
MSTPGPLNPLGLDMGDPGRKVHDANQEPGNLTEPLDAPAWADPPIYEAAIPGADDLISAEQDIAEDRAEGGE